jgi:hypothetical protein
MTDAPTERRIDGVDALATSGPAAAPSTPPLGPRAGPSRLPVALVVVATVLAVVSALTTWVRTQALDTDEWVGISQELLRQPEVQEALAVYLTDQLYAEVDVAAELEDLLPEDLSGLAGPLAGALRQPATEAVERLLASERFEQLWVAANRAAHAAMVAILRDETREAVSSDGGAVTLDLGEVVRTVGEAIGLPSGAVERIPSDAARITVFESDELEAAQSTVQILDFLSWFLFVVVVATYALAVYLARGRRPQVLRQVGIALVAGALLVLLLRDLAVRSAVKAVVQDPANESLASLTGKVATEMLRQIAWSGVVYGVLIAGFAELLGPRSWAVEVRRRLSRSSHGMIAGTAALVLVVVVWWSPGRALDRWVTAVTLVVLLAAGSIALVRAVRDEFPPRGHDDEAAFGAPV